VDAQTGRLAVLDVRLFDTVFFLQNGNEALHAAVFFVGDFGEEGGMSSWSFFIEKVDCQLLFFQPAKQVILLAVSFWPLAIGPSQLSIANSQKQMDNLSRTEGRENLALQSIIRM
jgi:hypothetical protein